MKYIGSALTAGSNPSNKVHLFAETEEWDTQSSIPQYPVQSGVPTSNFTAITSKTLTLTGHFFANDNVYNDYEAQIKIAMIANWQSQGILLTWWGRKGAPNLMIQEVDAVYDKSGLNTIGVTLTLVKVQVAGNAKRIVTRNAGRKVPVTGGRSKHIPVGRTKTVYVTAKRGNTYWAFSRQYGTSIVQLVKWNGKLLLVGRKVRVR